LGLTLPISYRLDLYGIVFEKGWILERIDTYFLTVALFFRLLFKTLTIDALSPNDSIHD
jgi:hypothetical protein